MALQLFRNIEIPSGRQWSGAGQNSLLLDASGKKAAGIFSVPESGTIKKVTFRTGTVTQSDVLKISFKTVDAATGNPTDTDYGGSSPTTQASVVSNTTYIVDFGSNPATAVKGDVIAIVIEFNSWVNGNLNIRYQSALSQNFPYSALYSGAAWTKYTYGPLMAVAYYVDTADVYYPISGCAILNSDTTVKYFNSGSAADEYALRFKLTFPFRVYAYWFMLGCSSTADFDVTLYSGTTALLVDSIDANKNYSDSNARIAYGHFNTTLNSGFYELAKDTEYRVAIKATTVNDIALQYITFSSAAQMGFYPGGSEFYGSNRKAGSWTNETTTRYLLGIIGDKLDDGVGGGASSTSFVGIRGAGLKVEHNVFE